MHIFTPTDPDVDRTEPRLWQGCVFVDWHGVLCDEPFWSSILDNAAHQLRPRLDAAATWLFEERREVVEDWMRGEIDSIAVVEQLHVTLFRNYKDDYLVRRLRRDCSRMTPRSDLLDGLRQLRGLTLIAVATDNMDCFADAATSISDLEHIVDGIVCSSKLGVLKAEDPGRFFGPVLESHALSAQDAVLIDDSVANCRRFEEWGGTAIHFTEIDDALAQLEDWQQALVRERDVNAPYPRTTPARTVSI